MLHSLYDNTIFPSGVCLGIIFLDNATLRSGGPFMFDFWYHLFDQHLRHLHPVDASDTLCFHCARRMILAGSFCCLLKDERLDANLAIKLTFGITIPYWPSHRTHEHAFCDMPLTFTCLMRRCLARDEVVVCIDLGNIEPFFINMYVVVHIVELLSPWIHKGICEIQTCDLVNFCQERLHCVGIFAGTILFYASYPRSIQ